jgi:hypothetical protein
VRDSVNNYDHIKNSDISNMIDEWIKSERDRKILKRRLIDGVCFEPLADEFQLSVSQTKRIIYRCENELFKHLRF